MHISRTSVSSSKCACKLRRTPASFTADLARGWRLHVQREVEKEEGNGCEARAGRERRGGAQ